MEWIVRKVEPGVLRVSGREFVCPQCGFYWGYGCTPHCPKCGTGLSKPQSEIEIEFRIKESIRKELAKEAENDDM